MGGKGKIMKKGILFLLLFVVSSWTWPTHEHIAEKAVSSLSIADKLNFTELKRGARAPDEVFRDFVNHHYPSSYKMATQWVSYSKEEFIAEHYNNASYGFGVASHYITDSFAAPHNVFFENPSLHTLFENQVRNYIPTSLCVQKGYNLFSDLDFRKKGKKDWNEWIITKNERIPRREVEESLKLLFVVAQDVFNASCKDALFNSFEDNSFQMFFRVVRSFFRDFP